MISLTQVVEKYGEDYLILDGRKPTILNSEISEEFKLYNISKDLHNRIFTDFYIFTKKKITPASLINELSGGQKIILSTIIALHSVAPKILFNGFFKALHPNRIKELKDYMKSEIFSYKELLEFEDFLSV